MEITANAVQTVAANQDILFTNIPISGNCNTLWRDGSGIVTLRGMTQQCRARYKVTFGGNVAIPSTGTAGAASFALAINGEAVSSTKMISTPGAVNDYNNIATTIFIDVPRGCCSQVSIKNIGTQSTNVQNANLIIERVA